MPTVNRIEWPFIMNRIATYNKLNENFKNAFKFKI